MTKRGDVLGDRMKMYEGRETNHVFTAFAPVIARMDGRAFSSWTKSLTRPYDPVLSDVMIQVAKQLVHATNARIGYTQSDEITLVLLVDEVDQTLPFGGRAQKLCSILASMTTALFITECLRRTDTSVAELAMRGPHFDARVFQVPTRFEASNAVLWRERDAVRNAVSTAARAVYDHRSLQGKSVPQMLAMLREDGAQDFEGYPAFFRQGSFLQHGGDRQCDEAKTRTNRTLTRPDADRALADRLIQRIDMPPFMTVANRDEVIFDRAKPVIRNAKPA